MQVNNAKRALFQAFLTPPPGWYGRGAILPRFYAAFSYLFCPASGGPATIRFEPFFLAALATGFLRYATMTRIGEA